ncbi:acyl carrier protein [Weissella paramesenteroides]|uniref:acyl carrier protein n=1 Tax=Weissella paramesenteroides TaxID=1249 RepID=UPI0023F6D4F7|nr:acyl carrier protein [Weissella paramesenteroides]MDF8373655.1 acyl carrier protein [Weissella paramesenteroides]WIG66640.1 acyl carrier protein [Weissella paramesenteroides]
MERQEILNKVITLVADHFELDPACLTGETNLMKDIDADSIDFVELVLEMEDEFGAEISDEDAEKLITINNTVDYIASRAK